MSSAGNRRGWRRPRSERADALVLFGATGDLARKKLFSAIYHMAEAGTLDMPVVGIARSGWDSERFRAHVGDRDR